MKEWKRYKLEDLLSIPVRNGLTKPSSIRGKGVKMIGMGELFANEIIRDIEMPRVPTTDSELKLSAIEKGDLLFARQSLTLEGAGKCSLVKEVTEPTVFESHIIRCRVNKNLVIPEYLYYYFRSRFGRYKIECIVEQVAAAGIRGKDLIKIEIPVPDIPTQRGIVDCLSTLDEKIHYNSLINDNLEQQASNLFQDWLNNCENSIMLRELTDNVLDYTPNTHKHVYLLNSSDVTEGQFTVLPLTPNINLKGQFKKRFKKGDILYSEIRPRNRHYAYCYFDADKYIASTRLIVLRAKPEKLTSSILLYQYLMLNNVFEEFTLKTESRSGTFPQGNYEDLSSIKVPYGASQEQISKALESIYKQLWTNLEENERLEALRDSLLPKLMSGELKINEIDC